MSEQTWEGLGIDVGGRTWQGYGNPNIKVKCPTGCSQKPYKKDLSVNLETGAYSCKNPGCGFQGYLSGSSRPVVTQSSQHIQAAPTYDASKYKRITVEEFIKSSQPLPREALEYLYKRGFTDETIKKAGLRWGTVTKDPDLGWIKGIYAPYMNVKREIVNVKKRPLDKDLPMGLMSGGEQIFYGLPTCYEPDAEGKPRVRKQIVITEGEYDTLAFLQSGVNGVVSVPNGVPADDLERLKHAQMVYLQACAEMLAEVDHFILATDNDKPGRALRDELARRLGREKCSFVIWPGGCKDANDVLLQFGPDMLQSLVMDAAPFPVSGIGRPADMLEELLTWKRDGMPSGASTGWPEVDQFWRPVEGEMTIVTGTPSMGKSEWLDALVVNLYRLHGWRGVVFSPENFPTSTHLVKLLEKWVSKPFDDRVARMWSANGYPDTVAMDEGEITVGVEELQQAFSFIMPDLEGDGLGIDDIFKLTRTEVFRRGVKFLIIDPWNEIEHDIPKGMSETQYISLALSKIRRFARHNGIHIFVVAHPAKMQQVKEKLDNGTEILTYPIPTLYHISGSSHFYNKADNGIVIHRNLNAEVMGEDPHLNMVKVEKVKKKWVGTRGVGRLMWHPPSGEYLPLDALSREKALKAKRAPVAAVGNGVSDQELLF